MIIGRPNKGDQINYWLTDLSETTGRHFKQLSRWDGEFNGLDAFGYGSSFHAYDTRNGRLKLGSRSDDVVNLLAVLYMHDALNSSAIK